MANLKLTLEERLWAKVERRGPDECWPWLASRGPEGYGLFAIGRRAGRRGRSGRAHRVVWEVTNGEIPNGLFVCHRCDNPPCCNPAHLFLGTNADNVADMVKKGRHAGNLKLSDDEVRSVCALASNGGRHRDIAILYGISDSYVSAIVRGLGRSGLLH